MNRRALRWFVLGGLAALAVFSSLLSAAHTARLSSRLTSQGGPDDAAIREFLNRQDASRILADLPESGQVRVLEALSRSPSPESVRLLFDASRADSERVQVAAVQSLAQVVVRRPALLEPELAAASPDRIAILAEAAAAAGAAGLELARKSASDTARALFSASTLARMPPADVLPILESMLAGTDAVEVELAARVTTMVGASGGKISAGLLRQAGANRGTTAYRACVSALAAAQDESAVEEFQRVLADPLAPPGLRNECQEALNAIRERRTNPDALMNAWLAGSPAARETFLRTGRLTERSLLGLGRILNGTDKAIRFEDRLAAATLLARRGTGGIRLLLRSLSNPRCAWPVVLALANSDADLTGPPPSKSTARWWAAAEAIQSGRGG